MRRIQTCSLAVLLVALLLCNENASAQTTRKSAPPIPYGIPSDLPPPIETNATSPHVVEMLAEALAAKPVVSRRVELINDLGLTGLPTALPGIEAAMSDPDPAVRAQAARSAAMLGDTSIRPALHNLLSDDSEEVRNEVVRAGASFNDPSFVEAGLNDKSDSVFSAACAAASTDGHDKQIVARLADLQPATKRSAIRALGRRKALLGAAVVADELQSRELPIVVTAI